MPAPTLLNTPTPTSKSNQSNPSIYSHANHPLTPATIMRPPSLSATSPLAFSTSPQNPQPVPSPRARAITIQSSSQRRLSAPPPALAMPPSPMFGQHPPGSVSPTRGGRRNSFVVGSLVGSYEESILNGRMSTFPSKPISFIAQIGVFGHGKSKLKCPPHVSVTFPAYFYEIEDAEQPTPYVGCVDLEAGLQGERFHKWPGGYRIPPRGQLQVVIKNPNRTAVKVFLLPYDFTDMPPRTKTFLRQKSYTNAGLRYAIHAQFCCTEKALYLYKSIRVVFSNRAPDRSERLRVVCDGPSEQEVKYQPWGKSDFGYAGHLMVKSPKRRRPSEESTVSDAALHEEMGSIGTLELGVMEGRHDAERMDEDVGGIELGEEPRICVGGEVTRMATIQEEWTPSSPSSAHRLMVGGIAEKVRHMRIRDVPTMSSPPGSLLHRPRLSYDKLLEPKSDF
ncbi:uncharacterized protein VTP21DRAFT_8693 [Calcarisporiella thermophila]|uniref:uncharacterized protein n=1 Tax=Calcarisporiella thermophila TaxID=911321 RepID=UPI00374257F1